MQKPQVNKISASPMDLDNIGTYEKPKWNNNVHENKTCFVCGKLGHLKFHCLKRREVSGKGSSQ